MLIYKFCAPARVNALESAKLRATQAGALNDPFELKPFFNAILERAEIEDRLKEKQQIEDFAREVYSKLPTGTRSKVSLHQVVAMLKQPAVRAQLQAETGAALDELMNQMPRWTAVFRGELHKSLAVKIGIVSFTGEPTETLMWAHYAVDHSGFAIAFNSEHPFFDRRRSAKDEFYHLRKVTYEKPSADSANLTDLDGTKVLCTKQPNWSYEREFRLLIPVDPAEDIPASGGEPVHLIDFPRDAVREVILGHNAKADLEQELRAILAGHPEYANVKLRRARADFSSGQIIIGD